MKLAKLIATLFFVGQAKIAPGSIASLLTTIVFYILAMKLDYIILVIIIFVTTILSFFAIHDYTTDFKEKDRSEIVIDEVVGQFVALSPLLFFEEKFPPEIYTCFMSFIFFRFFDIVKPYPIYLFDRMNSTFGVIFDDILAGIFSAFLLILTFIL